VIKIEGGAARRIRVIGHLDTTVLESVLEELDRDGLRLDLSEVDEADEAAVHALAKLPTNCCLVSAGPLWLQLWVERVREEVQNIVSAGAVAND
jgi:anti-anti-sigma regulatory factor